MLRPMRLLFCASAAAFILGAAPPGGFAFVAQAHAQAGVVLTASVAPPALPVYVQPPIPGPGYLWIPGYWAYDGTEWYWVPGYWSMPAAADLYWTPGYWTWNDADNDYVFNAGYWGPVVGFYGGIDYGYGYTGQGYHGGYWRDHRFFYNRAVNNLDGANIAQVFNQPVPAQPGGVAFNGGRGGTTDQGDAATACCGARAPHSGDSGPDPAHSDGAANARTALQPQSWNPADRGDPAAERLPRRPYRSGDGGGRGGRSRRHACSRSQRGGRGSADRPCAGGASGSARGPWACHAWAGGGRAPGRRPCSGDARSSGRRPRSGDARSSGRRPRSSDAWASIRRSCSCNARAAFRGPWSGDGAAFRRGPACGSSFCRLPAFRRRPASAGGRDAFRRRSAFRRRRDARRGRAALRGRPARPARRRRPAHGRAGRTTRSLTLRRRRLHYGRRPFFLPFGAAGVSRFWTGMRRAGSLPRDTTKTKAPRRLPRPPGQATSATPRRRFPGRTAWPARGRARTARSSDVRSRSVDGRTRNTPRTGRSPRPAPSRTSLDIR